MHNTDNIIDLSKLTTDSMFKLIANFILTSAQLKKVANIGIFYEDTNQISIDRVFTSEAEDIEWSSTVCIYIIDISFITLAELKDILPKSLEQVAVASYYDRLANKFSELEEIVELALEKIPNIIENLQQGPFFD